MKKLSLIIFIVLFFFLFSCAGTAKGKGTENNEQVTEDAAGQTDEFVKEAEKYADEDQIASENLTVNDGEEPAETADKLSEEQLNAEMTQADSMVGLSKDAESLSTGTESAASQGTVNETPSVTQTAAEQEQTSPSDQNQSTEQSSTSSTQPSIEGGTAVSEAIFPDSDSPSAREFSPSRTDDNPFPATRIESLTQMGTMPHDSEIIFSRIVYATVGQIIEIPFRGNGWIYLGEIASQRGIVYNSQRNESDGKSFIFTLENAGTYILKFYRQDFIRDYILIDHVQVIAEETQAAGAGWSNIDRGRVVAQPRWPSAVEETQMRNGTRPAADPVVTSGTGRESARESTPPQRTNTAQRPAPVQGTNAQDRVPSQDVQASSSANTGGQTAQSAPVTNFEQNSSEVPPVENREKLTPEAAMQKARQTFDGGNIQSAIDLLNQLMADYPDGGDEVYWLLGQYYEANSPARNILLSLDYYRRLVNEYPQSNYFNDARRRIAYLERFYINIQ
jgi:hypothetical protein